MSTDRADQPVTPDSTGIPGKTLASQREAMGWSVEQVADQLKLAVRQVVALEAGDYASLPSPAVTRGFVRAYAKIVKLDPIPLVAQIDLGSTGPNTGSSTRRERPASFSEVRFPSHGKRSALPLGIIAGAAVAVLAIAGIAYKFDAFPGMHHAPAVASTTPNAPLTSPGVASTELQSTSVPLISVPPPSSTSTGSGSMSPAGVAAPAAATPAATTAAPAAGPNALVLVVKQDVWLQVRKASGGKPLISRMVKGGTTETFDVSEPVNLTVGKPDAVDATFRGQPVALPLSPGKTYARVAVK
jgi:cytoskeleton protein RodZ